MPDTHVILLCTKTAKEADEQVKGSGYRCIEEIWAEDEWVHEGIGEGEDGETCLMCYSSGTVRVSPHSILLPLGHNNACGILLIFPDRRGQRCRDDALQPHLAALRHL